MLSEKVLFQFVSDYESYFGSNRLEEWIEHIKFLAFDKSLSRVRVEQDNKIVYFVFVLDIDDTYVYRGSEEIL